MREEQWAGYSKQAPGSHTFTLIGLCVGNGFCTWRNSAASLWLLLVGTTRSFCWPLAFIPFRLAAKMYEGPDAKQICEPKAPQIGNQCNDQPSEQFVRATKRTKMTTGCSSLQYTERQRTRELINQITHIRMSVRPLAYFQSRVFPFFFTKTENGQLFSSFFYTNQLSGFISWQTPSCVVR